MPDPRPLLFFPGPAGVAPRKRVGGAGPLHFPSAARQAARLDPRFQALQSAIDQGRVGVAADAAGAAPEQVVVFETIEGIDDFRPAAERAGLEWLGEFDTEDISPDEDFRHEKRPDNLLPTRLYLTLANQRAVSELLRLWQLWKTGGQAGLPHRFKKWGHMFKRLRDVRTWGPQDRIAETGLAEDFQERVRLGQERVRVQVELWFRSTPAARQAARNRVAALILSEGGTLLVERVIEEIGYHGLLSDLPIASVRVLTEMRDTTLVQAQEVMFYRPCGQGAEPSPAHAEATPGQERARPMPSGAPFIALFDGLPIVNHELLGGRLVVDDPDDWSPAYTIAERVHGTAMASLIVHGDLGSQGPALGTPLLVRPVTKPAPGLLGEAIPEDQSSGNT